MVFGIKSVLSNRLIRCALLTVVLAINLQQARSESSTSSTSSATDAPADSTTAPANLKTGTTHPMVATAKKEVLVQSDHSWDGTKYANYPSGQPELTMLKITIAPHSALPWHTHPVPNAGYVLSGDITIHDRATGKAVTYHAGQAFPESVDRIHRGESGDTETVLLVTYAGVKGTPTSKPVKGEMKEY